MPDIFISYRRSDGQSDANLLKTKLDLHYAAGQVFLDTSEIQPGADWPETLRQIARKAKAMLVCIGPDWLRAADPKTFRRRLDDPKDWVRLEIETALANSDCLVIPVLLRGASLPEADALPESLVKLVDCQRHIIRPGDWDEDLQRLLRVLFEKIPPAKNQSTSKPIPQFLTKPAPNPPEKFTGRELDLENLHKKLAHGGTLLLTNGTGGVGKTTLARKYFHDQTQHFRHMAWVECPNEDAVSGLLACGMAESLGIRFGQTDPPEMRLAALAQAMHQSTVGPNLLIIDNANRPEPLLALHRALGNARNWAVLITSRTELPDEFEEQKVVVLPAERARELFWKYYPAAQNDPENTEKLLVRTASHTLTLEVLAKTLAARPSYTLPELVADLSKNLLKLSKTAPVRTDWSQSAAAAAREELSKDEAANLLRACFDLARLTDEQRDFLTAWSVLPAVPIPFGHLEVLFSLREDAGRCEVFEKNLRELTELGWLERDPEGEGEGWKFHQIPHDVAFADAPDSAFKQFWELVVDALTSMLGHLNATQVEPWLPYADHIAATLLPAQPRVAWLACSLGDQHRNRGSLLKAIDFQELAREGWEKLENAQGHGAALQRLGDLVLTTGDLEKAVGVFEEFCALGTCKK